MKVVLSTQEEFVPFDEPVSELKFLSERLAALAVDLDELDEEMHDLSCEMADLDEEFERFDVLFDSINDTLAGLVNFLNLDVKSEVDEWKGGEL